MHPAKQTIASGAVVFGVILTFVFTCATAYAGMTAVSDANSRVNSASWGAAAAPQGGTSDGGGYVLLWLAGTAAHYFDVVNTGDTTLLSTTWSVSNAVSGSTKAIPEITFDACRDGSWDAASATCSGTLVGIGVTKRGMLSVTSSTTASRPGTRLSIRAITSNVNFPTSYTSTINLSVNRSQARAATSTTS